MNGRRLWQWILFTILLFAAVLFFSVFYHRKWFIFVPIVLLVIIIIELIVYYYGVIRPMQKISDIMSDSGIENPEKEIVEVGISYPLIRGWLNVFEDFILAKIQKNNARMFDKQTELTALQSQINPHFLYNTLDTIRSEALLSDDNKTAAMIETLASFFRYSISRKGSMVRLREELHNIENYMKIQEYQFGSRYILNIVVDEEDEEAYDVFVPRLILQPLVENALTHGLKDVTKNGMVTIECTIADDDLIIIVSDNGCGMDIERLQYLNDKIHSDNVWQEDETVGNSGHTGIALPNINKRIQLLYGRRYGVNVYSSLGQGTDVEITIPVRYESDEEIQ